MFLSSSDGKILVYNRGNYKSVEFSGHKQEVNCIDSKNGLMISGSRDRTTRVGPPFRKGKTVMSASFEFIETIVTEIMSYLYSKTLSNIFIYKITICYDIYINDKLSYISCNIVSFTFLFNTLSTMYSDCGTLDVGRQKSEMTLHLFLLLYSSFTCCV